MEESTEVTTPQDEGVVQPKRPNRPNKKKRKKFMANAKGFGKRGIYGRGAHIEQDQWSYFVNIMDKIREGFESLDDKLTMSNNVFDQTDGTEVLLSSNQVACKAVEYLLPFADAPQFERFQNAFAADFRPLCSDRFATHVLQKLVEISFLRAVGPMQPVKEETETEGAPTKKRRGDEIPSEKEYNLSGSFEAEHLEKCQQFVVKVSRFLLNNLEDFVWDQYGNHVMRTCLMCLGGVFVERNMEQMQYNDKARKKISIEKEEPMAVPAEWKEVAQEYASRLQVWPQFNDFPYEELPSALLQVLCIALRSNTTELKHLGKKLLNESFLASYEDDDNKEALDVPIKNESSMEIKEEDETEDKTLEIIETPIPVVSDGDKLPKVFTTESSVRLLEILLEISGPKLFTQLYAKLFNTRLQQLAVLPSVNFSVQKLLDNVREKTEFEAIYDEIAPKILEFLKIGHTGVVYAIANACQRLISKQGAFIQSIQTALDATGNKDKTDKFFLLVLKLKPYSVAKEDHSNFVHLHGSLILQAMLQFNKPIKLVQNILDARNDSLADIFCTPQGSHVADAFLGSKFIGEKSREKLIKHMEGTFLQMALSRNGSRALEAFFAAAAPQQKGRIVKELADKLNQLQSSPSGRLLNYKFKVSTYHLSPDKWKASLDRGSQVQKLFKDIV